MTLLNITYDGRSETFDLPGDLPEADVRRTAVELLRAGPNPGTNGLFFPDLPAGAFDDFVIDRQPGPEGIIVILRPKVPFGEETSGASQDDPRVAAAVRAILSFPWHNYGLDEVGGIDDEYAEYAAPLAHAVVSAIDNA